MEMDDAAGKKRQRWSPDKGQLDRHGQGLVPVQRLIKFDLARDSGNLKKKKELDIILFLHKFNKNFKRERHNNNFK